jgi:hypothetical protein
MIMELHRRFTMWRHRRWERRVAARLSDNRFDVFR